MLKHKFIALTILFLSSIISQQSHAVFPNDFSDVTWIDPDISSWAQTSSVTANVSGRSLNITDTKASVWPQRFHTQLGNSCCNRSLWIFIKYDGQWYATTFEYMRFGQVSKNAEAVNGGQIKRAPFLQSGRLWEPAVGEVYGFMTSGMARFDLNNNNVRERSNVSLYRWGVGPTTNVDFTEVPRGADGRPIEEGEEPPEEEPEVCVEPDLPQPVNNSHTYNGTASGTLVVSGLSNGTASYSEGVSIVVKDDRSLRLTINGEVYNDSVKPDGTFDGLYDLDVLGQCTVVINISGSISGNNASGTLTGSNDSCVIGTRATLNASFNAQSQTAPDYIDGRSLPPTPRSVCGNNSPALAPVINLLLD